MVQHGTRNIYFFNYRFLNKLRKRFRIQTYLNLILCFVNLQSCTKLLEAIVLQPFVVYTVTFLIFFEHDYSLKLSIGIIMMNHHGASTIKKVIVFKKQFFFAKTDNSLFRKKKYKTSLLVIRSLLAAAPPPRFLLTSIFDESRKIVLK